MADFENTYSKQLTVSMLPSTMRELERAAKKRGVTRNQLVREAIAKLIAESKDN